MYIYMYVCMYFYRANAIFLVRCVPRMRPRATIDISTCLQKASMSTSSLALDRSGTSKSSTETEND